MSAVVNREYEFTRRDFEFLSKLSNQKTGIIVGEDKFDMFYSRLSRRVRALGLKNFAEYCSYVDDPKNKDEITQLVNAITTNLTAFFRENHHFEYLKSEAIPAIINSRMDDRTLRVWSAGCSTGEEPYSLAMTLSESAGSMFGWKPKILATDIDSNVVATARAGIYRGDGVTGLPNQRLKRWFHKGKGAQEGKVRVRKELQQMIEFGQLNLMQNWSLPKMDIIFCRNVIIYFDKPTKTRLANLFADSLVAGGYLFIGHSESLFRLTDRFELIGNTVYRKVR